MMRAPLNRLGDERPQYGFPYTKDTAAELDRTLWFVGCVIFFCLVLMLASFVLGWLVGWSGSAC